LRTTVKQDPKCSLHRHKRLSSASHKTIDRVAGRFDRLWYLVLLFAVIYFVAKVIWPAVAWFIK